MNSFLDLFFSSFLNFIFRFESEKGIHYSWDTLIFLVSVMMNTYQHSFRKQGRRDESSVAIFPPSGQGIANAI